MDSSAVCPELGGWGFKDSLRQRSIRLSPVVGYEYRYLGENVHAGDFGVITEGGSGPVSFYLDARTRSLSESTEARNETEITKRRNLAYLMLGSLNHKADYFLPRTGIASLILCL